MNSFPVLGQLAFFFLVLSLFRCEREPSPSIPFVVCMGQSNMAGRGPLMAADASDLVDSRIRLWNDRNTWETAVPPLNKYSNIRKDISMQEMGPSLGMAKSLTMVYDSIGVLVNARGGSRILEWRKGGEYYDKTMERVKEAMKRGKLIGMVWHQGESDRNRTAAYPELLNQLIEDFRRDVNIPDLPVVIGEIGNWKGNSDAINAVLRAAPEMIPHLTCVPATDLSHKGDSLHFSREAQLILGTRYAAGLLQLIEK